MRKSIISALMAATLVPATGAMAQPPQEIRHDNRDVRDARQDLNQARRYGDRHDVRDARENLRDARQERREDWRDYRRQNRQLYTMPRYYAPRGLAYRPARAGVALNPAFYGQRYWIADPVRYRLPAAVGPQRWVRYGNDVLLINVRNGRVLQVINGFFY